MFMENLITRTKKRNNDTCMYRFFKKGEDLPRFINENNISKDRILATFTKDNQIWLYYWK